MNSNAGASARDACSETTLNKPGYDRDADFTECESLVSQTGSADITTLSSGGRTLSVLHPHHIIVAH